MAKSNKNKQNLQKFIELKETGNPKIREELIIENMYIAESIADSMANKYEIDNEELRQYAYEALIKAVDRYDVNLEKPFDSFLNSCIINYF